MEVPDALCEQIAEKHGMDVVAFLTMSLTDSNVSSMLSGMGGEYNFRQTMTAEGVRGLVKVPDMDTTRRYDFCHPLTPNRNVTYEVRVLGGTGQLSTGYRDPTKTHKETARHAHTEQCDYFAVCLKNFTSWTDFIFVPFSAIPRKGDFLQKSVTLTKLKYFNHFDQVLRDQGHLLRHGITNPLDADYPGRFDCSAGQGLGAEVLHILAERRKAAAKPKKSRKSIQAAQETDYSVAA
jgi:hypothetical protein